MKILATTLDIESDASLPKINTMDLMLVYPKLTSQMKEIRRMRDEVGRVGVKVSLIH